MSTTLVYYLKNTYWEFDFITKDLVLGAADVVLFEKEEFRNFITKPKPSKHIILVVNTLLPLHDIIEVAQYMKPDVLFYLSDEDGNRPEVMVLEQHTTLFLRQYNHANYVYGRNNYQIPLGYASHFKKDMKSVKPVGERKANCSFIGTPKSDRLEMTNAFKKHMDKTNIAFVNNEWNIDKLSFSPQRCWEVYNDSIFVICGRGNRSLDCFRIYEAIVAGAIPVLVGQMDEINISFKYFSVLPPFVVEETWEKAVQKCNMLLNDFAALESLQSNLLTWWQSTLAQIHQLIQAVATHSRGKGSLSLTESGVSACGKQQETMTKEPPHAPCDRETTF